MLTVPEMLPVRDRIFLVNCQGVFLLANVATGISRLHLGLKYTKTKSFKGYCERSNFCFKAPVRTSSALYMATQGKQLIVNMLGSHVIIMCI